MVFRAGRLNSSAPKWAKGSRRLPADFPNLPPGNDVVVKAVSPRRPPLRRSRGATWHLHQTLTTYKDTYAGRRLWYRSVNLYLSQDLHFTAKLHFTRGLTTSSPAPGNQHFVPNDQELWRIENPVSQLHSSPNQTIYSHSSRHNSPITNHAAHQNLHKLSHHGRQSGWRDPQNRRTRRRSNRRSRPPNSSQTPRSPRIRPRLSDPHPDNQHGQLRPTPSPARVRPPPPHSHSHQQPPSPAASQLFLRPATPLPRHHPTPANVHPPTRHPLRPARHHAGAGAGTGTEHQHRLPPRVPAAHRFRRLWQGRISAGFRPFSPAGVSAADRPFRLRGQVRQLRGPQPDRGRRRWLWRRWCVAWRRRGERCLGVPAGRGQEALGCRDGGLAEDQQGVVDLCVGSAL